jgi:uncharacterized repeat protein (TIGR03803 family)
MKKRQLPAIGVLVAAIIAIPLVQAQTYTVLYNFTGGSDGANPSAGVIQDSAGNLYGTTYNGGTSNAGVVFKLDTTGKETVLYNFTGGSDGANPSASVIRDSAGNLYGTTYDGGTSGFGVVFKLDTTGKERVLYSFTGGSDGANPTAGVIRDSTGNFYGTTIYGGSRVNCFFFQPFGCGVVFKLDTTRKETVLYSFTGGSDDRYPYAGVIRDSAGNLYGTTSSYGTLFKLDTTGKETVLFSFTGGTDGGAPSAGVIRDSAGNLYGTTYNGGTSNAGVVLFKLGTTGKETVLHNFAYFPTLDGTHPSASVIRDSAGNFYGTTYDGGTSGFGVVFKIAP